MLAGRGIGPLAGGPLRRIPEAARTSSGPGYCGRRQPASTAPRACHWRDSGGTPPRPRARGGVPVRRRRGASRGLPFGDALDCVVVEHLRQHFDAARVSWHEHAQLPGDDLPKEAVGAQSIAHRVVESRQFDAVCAHDPDAAELEAFGEVEDGPALRSSAAKAASGVSAGASAARTFATQAAETLRPMMRSPASVCSR